MTQQHILKVDDITWNVRIFESENRIYVHLETMFAGPLTFHALQSFSEWLEEIVMEVFDKEDPRIVTCNIPRNYLKLFRIEHLFT